MDAVKVTCITTTYETLFSLLTDGKVAGATPYELDKKPQYPPQKCNDVLINICSDLAESLEEIVDLVFPADFEKIADSRLLLNTRGNTVTVGSGTVAAVGLP